MRTLAAVTLALLLTGCAQKVWSRPAATAQDFRRDNYECQAQSARTGSMHVGYGIFMPINTTDGRLAAMCMRARGYELREVREGEEVWKP